MISRKCIDLVKSYEGLKLKAYPDPKTGGEPITIGYGSTRYSNGDKIKLGEIVTMEQAERLLLNDLEWRYKAVKAWLPEQINQNQIDALLSFIYNIGVGRYEKSTIRKMVWRNPNNPLIRDEFMKWVNPGTNVTKGLTNRRKAESELYFSI